MSAPRAPSVDAAIPHVDAGAVLACAYRVIAPLHRGYDLDIYDVWSEERGCRCVAKVLRPDRAQDRRARAGLLREGRLLLRLTHPHIVRAYELITEPQTVLILETLSGVTLAHLIAGGKRRLPWRDLAYLGIHLCSAIGYLHRHGYLHLDLKPSNVVCEHGLAKVLDLSIARRPGRGPRGVGTPHYMAPEQVRGGDLSTATDVWGIGAVLFEAATGEPPFGDQGTTHEQRLRRAMPVRDKRRVPVRVAERIDRCLDPDPARRPAVWQLGEALRVLVGD